MCSVLHFRGFVPVPVGDDPASVFLFLELKINYSSADSRRFSTPVIKRDNVAIRHGCNLSPTLFNVYTEEALKHARCENKKVGGFE